MLDAILERLYARRRFGMRPGLTRIRALLERLGNPQRELAAVHVAGTNGKGSVVAMIASVLRQTGLSVGRYTSPHLLRFNERICIDDLPVEDEPLLEALRTVEAAADAVARDGGGEATFFECATAAAFLVVRQRGVRLAVVETGLGGRLDATNVLDPLPAVITRIGLEHREHLGDTIGQIAGEKAGIIKPGRPVVIGAMPPAARETIRETAARLEAPLVEAEEIVTVEARPAGPAAMDLRLSGQQRDLGRVRLPLGGSHQAENAATAVAALEVWSQATGIGIADAAFRTGLETVCWPGRFQQVRREPPVIVDGGHNPDAAAAIRATLRRLRLKGPVGLVAGFCDDKDVAGFMRNLGGQVRRGWAVTTPSPRTLAAAATAGMMRRAGIEAQEAESLAAALAAGEHWAASEKGLLLVCGSLFLAGAALQHYNAYPWPTGSRPPDPNEQMRGEAP